MTQQHKEPRTSSFSSCCCWPIQDLGAILSHEHQWYYLRVSLRCMCMWLLKALPWWHIKQHHHSQMIGMKDLCPCCKHNSFIFFSHSSWPFNYSMTASRMIKTAAWGPAIWFIFGIFKWACRQMDAPLIVYYYERNPFPLFMNPAPSQIALLSNGGVKARSASVAVAGLIDLAKKEATEACCLHAGHRDRHTPHMDTHSRIKTHKHRTTTKGALFHMCETSNLSFFFAYVSGNISFNCQVSSPFRGPITISRCPPTTWRAGGLH